MTPYEQIADLSRKIYIEQRKGNLTAAKILDKKLLIIQDKLNNRNLNKEK